MNTQSAPVSKGALWTGYIMTALPSLLLVFSGITKIMRWAGVEEGFSKFGLSLNLATPLGVLEIACTLIYLIPRLSVLGAILLTGYLGGAVLANVRIGEAAWFMPIVLGVIIWGGLFMRDLRIRALIPLRS